MFDFGDDLIIESYRIPWLIWIQLLVMLLLLILLYSLSTSPSDLSLHSTAAAAPSTSSAANRPLLTTSTATTLHHSKQAGGNQINETGTSTSSVVQGARKDESRQTEDACSSMKDAGHGLIYGESYHPCNFLGLAKQAFLKCLGLDSPSESPSRSKHGKDD